MRKRRAISLNDGRATGSGAQHCSIRNFHSGSQELGTGGLSVLLTMPPAAKERGHQSRHESHIIEGRNYKTKSPIKSFSVLISRNPTLPLQLIVENLQKNCYLLLDTCDWLKWGRQKVWPLESQYSSCTT